MLDSSFVDEWKAEVQAKYEAEWMAEGEAEGRVLCRRENIMRALQIRLSDPVPADLEAVIRAQTDMDTMPRRLEAAVRAASLDEFRAVVLRQA